MLKVNVWVKSKGEDARRVGLIWGNTLLQSVNLGADTTAHARLIVIGGTRLDW